jgi:quinol monooxygenase YgiN
MTIHVIAHIKAKPEHQEAVRAAMVPMTVASRKEPGNLRYDLLVDRKDPSSMHVVEAYRDEAALEAHRNSAHYAIYREATGVLLEQPVQVAVLAELDVQRP